MTERSGEWSRRRNDTNDAREMTERSGDADDDRYERKRSEWNEANELNRNEMEVKRMS